MAPNENIVDGTNKNSSPKPPQNPPQERQRQQPLKSLVQQHQSRNLLTQTAYKVSGNENNETAQPSSRQWESDLVVVLDMDECLIHSQFLSQQPTLTTSDSYRQFEADRPYDSSIKNTCESFCISLPDGDQVHVNKRPELDYFLKHVTRRFETHIFTAAMKVYASPVLDTLDPRGNMLQQRFYRESCSLDPELGVYVKDIRRVLQVEADRSLSKRFNEKRVVLIDNNPLSFLANPSNGILVSNFYDDPEDDTLPAVLNLLDELDGLDDVRPALDKMFGLKDALMDVIKNPSSQ